MDRILILNSTYEPLSVVSWKRAIRMVFQEKVEIVAEYEREVRSVTMAVRLPSVLRLRRYVKHQRYHCQVKFSRTNIYARDRYRCQYCGRRHATPELTYDHVVPVSRGGVKSWENIVTCCVPCNRRKGNRTPHEAGLRLLKKPKAPMGFPYKLQLMMSQKKAPEVWRNYIFA
ncbi:MAG TPA: HNH endonuclease [Acidobacteriota bacterium]|nr:HNH endonuclease [Acidobacteriota bacterium]